MTKGGDIGKFFGTVVFGEEMVAMIYDLRWAIALCAALILADLWLGCRTSSADGKEVRKSRAIRRTANKFVDYIMYMLVAAMIGMVVEQLGWWSHTNTALCGILIGCFCEIESIWGHWAKLHGYTFSLSSLLVKIVKSNHEKVGEIIEEMGQEEKKHRGGATMNEK